MCFLGHDTRQLVERGDLPACQNVGLARGRGNGTAESKARHEIVDVGQVVEDAPVAENHEPAAAHAAEEFEKTTIAGAIDSGGPDDDDFDPGRASGVASNLLPFQLGLLIDIAGPERRILVGWWAFDVSVHADRAAMNDAARPARLCRFDDGPHGGRVDRAILGLPQSCLTVNRGDMIDDLDPIGRGAHRIAISHIPVHDLNCPGDLNPTGV